MSDHHDVLSARYWLDRAQHMRDLTAGTPDHTSRAAYVRLMRMYERMAKVARADRGGQAGPVSIPLLVRRPSDPSKAA